jgi:class 3 adenylate cyclase/predicted ATPase
MIDVGEWLRSLGLGQYEPAFREHAIDEAVLCSLTTEDLRDLGVGIVGHRRRLLNAIAALQADGMPRPPSPEALSVPGRIAKDDGERRYVTVMFSDLVGSMALSIRSDLEDLREIIATYQNCVAEVIRRFDGFVAKFIGDSVLAYFGYPEAHEDDAERAVRAGLAVIAAVRALAAQISLQTRVGIATGLVVVGDVIGSGEARERAVVGDTPNLASRLQGIAEPDTVVISDATRRLLGNLFELQILGPRDLKGIAGPVQAWAVVRASSIQSRFEALRPTDLTALVGREEEIDLLLRRWTRAKTGEGQVLLLSGEAGIGKSRLTVALSERLASEPHARLRYFCAPQHTDSALYPIIGQMERAAGLVHDDTPEAKLDKLEALLAQTSTSTQDNAHFAEMLSLPNDGRYPALELTPQQRREGTLDALVSQIDALTHQNPVLIVFEDAHWIDPTSLEVLGRVVHRIASLPVLMIVTFRREFEPPWIGQPHVTALTINRLARREVATLIGRIVGDRPLSASIRQDIIERTDGIPLFVEELTKAVLEAESEGEARRSTAAIPHAALAVPPSLQASLLARLDRLGPAKEVAQIGAAIGREFSHALLSSVAHQPQSVFGSALDRLVVAGLLFRQGVPPHATYVFKHALLRDAAYGTLLREPRRVLHARIAETLECQFTEIAETQPELLARHCTEAGLIEKAAKWWSTAGQRSLARSALVEAVEQLTHALGQIETLPGTPAARREQIRLQVALITPLIHVKGFAAPEAKAAAERARLLIEQAEALGEAPEDPLALFSALYGCWIATWVAFDGDKVRELAAQFLALAEKQGAAISRMIGHRIMGIALLSTGDLAQGRAHLDRAFALYDPTAHRPLAARFGVDSKVSVLSFRSLASWLLGFPEAGLADSEQALSYAREIGQAATLMYALTVTSFIHTYCGDYAAATAQSEEVIALAVDKSALFWKAAGMMRKGSVLALTGSASDAVGMIAAEITTLPSTGALAFIPLWLSSLGSAAAKIGQFDHARRNLSEALRAVETTKEKWCEAEVHRVAGEVALLIPEPDMARAEAHFERALEIARTQSAKSWELRAAMNMARLWRQQGKQRQAGDLLAPVYGWFTEGFETLDLREARDLLDQLSL